MKYYLKLFIIGLIVGIGKILPGISGALFVIYFGLYEKILWIINKFPRLNKEDMYFSTVFGLGFILSIWIFSKILYYTVDNYYVYIVLFIIGVTCNKNFINKVRKNYILTILSTVLFLFFRNFNISINLIHSINYISSIILGLIEAFSMIIPGLSGSAILLILSVYDDVLYYISIFKLSFIIPYYLGIFIGVIILSKVLTYIIKVNRNIFNNIVFLFTFLSVIYMFFSINIKDYSLFNIFLIFTLFCLGIFVGNFFER